MFSVPFLDTPIILLDIKINSNKVSRVTLTINIGFNMNGPMSLVKR